MPDVSNLFLQRLVEEGRFTTHDGVAQSYRRWPARTPKPRGAIVLLNPGSLADELDLPDFEFYANDANGSLQDFAAHLGAAHGHAPDNLAVIAQAAEAVTAATWAHDFAPRLRALVLVAPTFGEDETARRIVADARAIIVPTQLLIPTAQGAATTAPQDEFFINLGSPFKERHRCHGRGLGEPNRAPVLNEMRRFLLKRFAEPLALPCLLDADLSGYTRDEADRLATPLPAFSARGLYWKTYRASLVLSGLLSRGIALGRKTGFDSGSTLDYVYRNQAAGFGPLGRLLDRAYLDAIGWKGIRQRKLHLEELIGEALTRLAGDGQPARILDIAAGHGRYVLEALAGAPQRPASILLKDYSPLNVAAGRRLIAEKGLGEIARFEPGDAFDADSIAAVDPKPTLGIVSGLYELFADNASVRRSLGGLAAAIPAGGYLIYTGQPWHPQLEMIARALTSHRDGKPWVMRRRTQAELDQLVAAAGFTKLEQRIDRWGIFTVSLAVRGTAGNGG